MWHVSSRSGEATLRTAIGLLSYYILWANLCVCSKSPRSTHRESKMSMGTGGGDMGEGQLTPGV